MIVFDILGGLSLDGPVGFRFDSFFMHILFFYILPVYDLFLISICLFFWITRLFFAISAWRLVGRLKRDILSPSYTIIHCSLFWDTFDLYFPFSSFQFRERLLSFIS